MNKSTLVSIVVLAYNEAGSITDVLKDLVASLENKFNYEVIVVNNGSTDKTSDLAHSIAAQNTRVVVLDFKSNLGYGGGIKAGIKTAKGEVVGYMSGDNQYEAGVVARLLEKMFAGDLDFVTSFRSKRYDGLWRLFISRVFHIIYNTLFKTSFRDINNNPKIFKKSLLDAIGEIEHSDWFIDAEIMWKLVTKFPNYKMADMPMEFRARPSGSSNVNFKTIVEFLKNIVLLYNKK